MSVRRLASSAALFAALSGGCAASRVGHLTRPEPLVERPQLPAPGVAEFVSRHNQNAEQITSLEAAPTVSGKFGMRSAGTRGRMVFERPHNFRFVVESGFAGKTEADIGSNEDEFWFWANDKNDPHVYVARYDAATSPAANKELTFQPDWIVEALGFREISEEEARTIKISNGPRPNTIAWTHYRKTLRGEPVKKVTILDRTTGQIIEHQFYVPGMNAPIASASPIGIRTVALASDPSRSVSMPKSIHLKLAPADPRATPIEMDLTLNNLKVNAPIPESNRAALFNVPSYEGSTVTRLNEAAEPGTAPRTAGNRKRSETRNSATIPEAGAELGEPAPFGTDEAYLKKSDPMPLSPDLSGQQTLVGMPSPTPVDNPAEKLSRRENGPFQK
jgi:hypothetical protein